MSNPLSIENLSGAGVTASGHELDGFSSAANLSVGQELRVREEALKQGLHGVAPAEAQSAGGAGINSFSQMLEKTLGEVNRDQIEADHAIRETIAGRNKNIHETLLAVERADTSLKLMMQVRNKVLDAYREIMRMQV